MADSAYIRDTYAHFTRTGVPHDGIAEGVEHTRYKQDVPPWECVDPPTSPPPALHVDRYGFFDTPKQPSCIVLARHVYVHRRMLQRTRQARTPKSHVREPSADHVKTMLDHRASSDQRRASRRTRKWHGMLNESERCIEPGVSHHLLQRRVFKGIPDDLRGLAWYALSAQHSSHDPRLLSLTDYLQHASTSDVQIDLDIPRTVRGHKSFHTRYGRGQCDLFCVLHAMSLMCAECGYCQGMGPLAAMLLMHMPASDALRVMQRMHDVYGFHELFRPGFPGLRAEFYVLSQLLDALVPRMAQALAQAGLAPSAYATRWLLTVFHDALPHATQLRVWDIFMACGRDALLVVAVGLLRALDMERYASRTNDMLECLWSPFLPEDDDALLAWVQHTLHSRRVQTCIQQSRAEWSRLVEQGHDGSAFV